MSVLLVVSLQAPPEMAPVHGSCPLGAHCAGNLALAGPACTHYSSTPQHAPTRCRAHAAANEKAFFDDMRALGVRPPTAAPRVTDHMPQIIAYVEAIVAAGFAYPSGHPPDPASRDEANAHAGSNGRARSVYFDVAAFRRAGHTYGKLKPWAVGSAELACEGESDFGTAEKRGPQDFALWKAAKAGEPAWESPWGPGRPGWHIECSAMVGAVAPGGKLDLHSGGDDLRFPHHDNEIAQAEAHDCGAPSRDICIYVVVASGLLLH